MNQMSRATTTANLGWTTLSKFTTLVGRSRTSKKLFFNMMSGTPIKTWATMVLFTPSPKSTLTLGLNWQTMSFKSELTLWRSVNTNLKSGRGLNIMPRESSFGSWPSSNARYSWPDWKRNGLNQKKTRGSKRKKESLKQGNGLTPAWILELNWAKIRGPTFKGKDN